MNVSFVGMAQPPVFYCEKHCHSEWEITYYLKGHGVLTIGDDKLLFNESDIICQPAGIPHSEYSEQGFRDVFVTVVDFINPWSGIPLFKDNNNHDFKKIMMQMYREFHLKQENWGQIVDSLFNVLYQYMIAWDKPTNKHTLVEKLEKVLISNITNSDFKIDKCLGKIPVSADYLRKIFKKQTGMSPIEYLTSKRINYAKRLLKSSSSLPYKIKEVAYMSGYSDPYYFSRLFRKETGESPTEWSIKAI